MLLRHAPRVDRTTEDAEDRRKILFLHSWMKLAVPGNVEGQDWTSASSASSVVVSRNLT
jgi:hypothetical protein